MKIKYFFLTGFLAILLIFSIPVVQKLLGYYPGLPGWEMAQIAVKKQNVKLCERITALPWAIFVLGPPTAERRISCVHRYATLAKDPSACELLMPSSYGLSCVGGATRFLPCFFSDKRTVVWSESNLEKDRREFPFESCSTQATSVLGKSCCLTAQSRFTPQFTDCTSLKLSDPLMHDQCEYEVAIKNLSPDTCVAIKDSNLQSSCRVQVGALQKYPELRENYLFINQ